MRPVGAISKLLGVALAVAAFATASVEATPRQNEATVRSVRGTANYSTDAGANWKKLNVGTRLKQNSVLRTAPGAVVDLYMGENGPVVRLTEATTMGLDKLMVDTAGAETVIETQLDLRNGRILGNVKKLAEASKYEVKTPYGVAGIRGTQYDISADGTVTVVEGTVIVVYVIDGQTLPAIVVNEGQTVRPPVRAGEPVTPMPANPGLLDNLRRQFVEIDRGGTPPPVTPTVVIVVEPKEALQEGDRFKTEPTPEPQPTPAG